jgi:protein-disulfide isomerase
MSLGSPNAPVTVVEYASVTCGHCAKFNEEVFPAFKKKHVDTGQVRYVLKELPTPPQQVAVAGFLLARCAGRERYFTVVDQIMRSQPRWTSENLRQTLVDIGKANGVSEAQFEACLADRAALDELNARVEKSATADKITGTPTFFVNGKRLPGIPTLAQLDAAIAEAAKARRR